MGAAVLVVLARKRATVIQLHDGGIVEMIGEKRRQLAWEDVLSFERSGYASVLYRLSVLNVKFRDGTRLNLNSQHLRI